MLNYNAKSSKLLKNFVLKRKKENFETKYFFKNSKSDKFIYNKKKLLYEWLIIILLIRLVLIILIIKTNLFRNNFYKHLLVINSLISFSNIFVFTNILILEKKYEIFSFLCILLHSNLLTNDITFNVFDFILRINLVFEINDIFNLINCFLIVIIFCYILYNSFYFNNRCHRICKIWGCELNFNFLVRCFYKSYHITFIILTMILFLLIMGLLLFILENKYLKQQEFYNNIVNCFWMIFLTMNSCGFGDRFFITFFGRIVGGITALSGLVFMSLVVVSSSKVLEFRKNEKISYITINNLHKRDRKRIISSEIIKILFKIKRAKNDMNFIEINLLLKKLKLLMNKNKRKKFHQIRDCDLFEEILYVSTWLENRIKEIIELIKDI